MAIIVSNVSGVAPTSAGGSGSLTYDVDVSGGSGAQGLIVSVYQFDTTAPGNKGPLQYGIGGITPGPGLVLPNLPAGKYVVEVTEVSGPAVGAAPGTVPAYIPPPAVPGCTNPDADNYDPDATSDNGSCTFSPKLGIRQMTSLVPIGRPYPVAMSSANVLWGTPAAATATITLSTPVADDALTVNGYRFVCGPVTAPDRFEDAQTLVDALAGVPALLAAYRMASSNSTVTLTARTIGPAGTPTLTSTASTLTTTVTPGQPASHSQRRAQWGCWLEVWAVPNVVLGATSKAGAVLAGSFESRYREDNYYQFDIAPCLQAFTALDYECAGRLVGFFLRYGETYADTPQGYRRRRPAVAETDLHFGLEAVEIVRPVNGTYVLTRRPGAWTLPDSAFIPVASLTAGSAVRLDEYTGARAPVQRQDADMIALANGQGGVDHVAFEGVREPLTKRTGVLVGTPTGRRTQKAETPRAFRLNSGLLLREEWEWLRMELGNTAAVWEYVTDDLPVPINITGLTAESDEVKGEYRLAIECEYENQTGLGLSN